MRPSNSNGKGTASDNEHRARRSDRSQRPPHPAAVPEKKDDATIAREFLAYIQQNTAELALKIAAFRQTHPLSNWDDIEQHIKSIFRTAQKLPETQILPSLTPDDIKLLQMHLDRSHVQRHPIKYGLMGSSLVLLLGFATAFLVMIAVQAFATVAVMPAIIAALPFLAFLTPIGPIVGILAFSAMIAALMLPIYGLIVATVHKATQPVPSELVKHALTAQQESVKGLNGALKDERARVTALNATFTQGFEGLSAKIQSSHDSILRALAQSHDQTLPAPPSSPEPELTRQHRGPASTPPPATTGHQRTLSDNSAANPEESPRRNASQ